MENLDIENIEEDLNDISDFMEKDEIITTANGEAEDLLASLKPSHKNTSKMYFDEDYFADLVLNKYLPTVKRDSEGKIIASDKVLEKEVLANMLLIVNAVINKYGIWRFERREILRNEGLAECWRSLPTFDPSRKKKFFHFLSLVAKYHLINLTKKDKDSREMADVSIQPDLESQKYIEDNFFFEDMEITLFDIIDENFSDDKEKHDKYIDLASILMEYVKKNRIIIGKNDLFSTFREYGYKTNDYKKFIADIEPFKDRLYDLV